MCSFFSDLPRGSIKVLGSKKCPHRGLVLCQCSSKDVVLLLLLYFFFFPKKKKYSVKYLVFSQINDLFCKFIFENLCDYIIMLLSVAILHTLHSPHAITWKGFARITTRWQSCIFITWSFHHKLLPPWHSCTLSFSPPPPSFPVSPPDIWGFLTTFIHKLNMYGTTGQQNRILESSM